MSENSSSANEGNRRSSKKRRDEAEKEEDNKDTSNSKKPRVVWSMELHQKFLAAINELGMDKAIPMKILETMDEPGLKREHVASHLQKYRAYLKKLTDTSQHQKGLNITSPEAASGSTLPSLRGSDLFILASNGQLPTHTLASLHAAAFDKPETTSATSTPVTEKRNRISSKPQNFGFRNGQHEASNNNNKQASLSLFQGIPTNMEPRHSNLHSAQPFLSMNGSSQVDQCHSTLMRMDQLQSRGQFLNQTYGSQVPGIQYSNGQTLLSNAIPSVWTPNGVERGRPYGHVSQGSSMVNYSIKQSTTLPGTSFPLMSDPGMTPLSLQPVYQGEQNTENKDLRNFFPSYDLSNGLHLQQTPYWSPQNVGSNLHASQHMSFQGSYGGQKYFSSYTNSGGHTNLPIGGGQNNNLSMSPVNPFLADNSMRAGFQSNRLSESFGHDDPLSTLLKQKTPDWNQRNVSPTFPASQYMAFQGTSGQNDFASSSKSGDLIDVPIVEVQNNTFRMGPLNPLLDETSRIVKSANPNDPDCQRNQFSESFGNGDDLMSVVLKQKDEVIPVDNDFGFDGYSLDQFSSS